MKFKLTHATEKEKSILKSATIWMIALFVSGVSVWIINLYLTRLPDVVLGVFALFSLIAILISFILFVFIFLKLISIIQMGANFKVRIIRYLIFLLLFILTLFLFNYRVQFLGVGSLGWCVIVSILTFSLYQPKNLSTYGRNKKIFYTFISIVILTLSIGRMMSSSRTFNAYGVRIRVESHQYNFDRNFGRGNYFVPIGHANYFVRTGIISHNLQRVNLGKFNWRNDPELNYVSSFFSVNHFYTISPDDHVWFSTVNLNFLPFIYNIIILGTAAFTLELYVRGQRLEKAGILNY